MSYRSLRDFITTLQEAGELVRIAEPVATHLEMTEIQTRVLASGGPALLFEKPLRPDGTISPIPVLTNLFGTVRRVAMGVTFGGKARETAASLREVGEMLAEMRQPKPPKGFGEAIEMWPMAKAALAMRPKTVGHAPCQQIVLKGDEIDLDRLPIQGCWPGEPAPLISWPLVITPGDESEPVNLGVYRMQVLNRNQTVMRWLAHRGGAQAFARWKESHSGPMPVAVALGADPGTILAAVTPVPETLSEYQFAGLIRGARVELADCLTQPLQVPAEAEIILEGMVSDEVLAEEGPYGDHTGYYNAVERFPVFTVTAITMRKDPIYLSTFTGRAPDEPSVMGAALNEMFIPLIQQQFPEIVDFWLPPEGCSYRIAIVSIKKAYPGHAKRIMMGVWSYLRQFLYTKWVIVVDDDIHVRDWKDVMWAVATRMDPARDITLIEGTPIDYLDFASPESGLGSKIGLDATNKMAPEVHREWGTKLAMDQTVIDTVTEKWSRLGLPGDGKPIWK
ncbi:MAG: UbiD family decarboxylase [Rhizomicrobium sp.]